VAPPNTRPNISRAASTQNDWSIVDIPSLSTLGMNSTTRTRLRPLLRTLCLLRDVVVGLFAMLDQYRSLAPAAQRPQSRRSGLARRTLARKRA
jgi:hypothetical protein